MCAKGEDLDAGLRRIYETLRDREDPPTAWSDPSEVAWRTEEFSRDYARAAARDPDTSEAELEHIVAATGVPIAPAAREAWKILDLGCGDGRLLLPLARMGHAGYGIDLGPAPVRSLQERASSYGLAIQALVGDLRDWSRGEIELGPSGEFDLALLSFGTLGAVPAPEGRALLEGSARVLRPGGWIYLDLGLSIPFAEELDGRQEWWTAENFVLGEGPQLVLDDHAYDSTTQLYVRRSFAVRLESPPRVDELRQTSRLYGRDELQGLLEAAGFDRIEAHGDFHGSLYDPEHSENLVVVARRVHTLD